MPQTRRRVKQARTAAYAGKPRLTVALLARAALEQHAGTLARQADQAFRTTGLGQ
jgi:hypothetical protein